MKAHEIRELRQQVPMDTNGQILTEIAAQLAELNEKFADYFLTLGPEADPASHAQFNARGQSSGD